MSLWYDRKGKSYASKGPSAWIKYYAEHLAETLRQETESRFTRHFSAQEGRHSARDVDYDSDSTVRDALEAEAGERADGDRTIRAALSAETAARDRQAAELEAAVQAAETALQADMAQKASLTYVDQKTAPLAQRTEVLTKTNHTAFTPSAPYHPATKDYVDGTAEALSKVQTILAAGLTPGSQTYTDAENRRIVMDPASYQFTADDGVGITTPSFAVLINGVRRQVPALTDWFDGTRLSQDNNPNLYLVYSPASDFFRIAATVSRGGAGDVYLKPEDLSEGDQVLGGFGTIYLGQEGPYLRPWEELLLDGAPETFGVQQTVNFPEVRALASGDVLTRSNNAPYTPDGDYNPATKKYVDDAGASKADAGAVLTKTNTAPYVPAGEYHPATKKYVDDAVSQAGGGDMSKSVYDTNGSGVVDDAEMLGGQPPSYYATTYTVNGKAPANHANMNTIYGVGTTMSYGHVKITDEFTQDERKHGIALSGYAGYVLDSRLTAVETAVIQPPALTELSAYGTQAGSSGWTGTGFFCPAAGVNYAAGSGVDARLSGFNRFCLRFAEPNGRNWTFWTPYLDMDGTDYEFFYVPARGLYEALIPAAGKPATQILAGVYWKNVTPDILRYGKLSGMIGYFAQTGSGGERTESWALYADEASLRDVSGPYNDNDIQAAVKLCKGGLDMSGITNLNLLAKLHLCADAAAQGEVNMNSATLITQKVKQGTPLPIETVDNFSA